MAGVALFVACLVPATAKPLSPQVVVCSPLAEEVAPRDAWHLAEAYAAARSDCDTLVGRGDSMLPLYRDRTVIVIQRMNPVRWERGMTVVYFGTQGQMVAHVLVEKTPRGWIAQGVGNDQSDRALVKPSNYVGTVIKAYSPNPAVKSVREGNPSVAVTLAQDTAMTAGGGG